MIHIVLIPVAFVQLKDTMERMNMSARAYECILKVARTITDLVGILNN